ncbi:MAG: hypothetical protein KDA69_09735 [Planctomycetaceae bacterium]|nr:hypothetical protein [Planctomycetaceae bacterium]
MGQVPLPSDVKPTCVVSEADFAKWFQSGSVSPGGAVLPADSVNFPLDNTNCDFYKWSWQMFLWMNSPTDTGAGIVFDGAEFYDVSPGSSSGKRVLLPNTKVDSFLTRTRKTGVIKNGVPTDETGQAGGGGTLMAQSGSLLYYGLHVNNVYAYFLTGQKTGALPQTTFPTTAADLAAINKYAGFTLPDGQALSLELKTSWVEAETLESIGLDPAQYVLVQGSIPTYAKTDTTWTPSGTTTTTMALVGMHIVGSVQGHPEMIWASFEHINNCPANSYDYTTTSGATGTVPYNSDGRWLLTQSGAMTSGANSELMNTNSDGVITAKPGQQIGPSNVYRVFPWGNLGNDAKDNTDIVSINLSVLSQLPQSDVRSNYVMIGALWNQHGNLPPGGNQIGSKTMANSTMETFHQDASMNCFSCHQGTSFGQDDLSHIYFNIVPVIPTK